MAINAVANQQIQQLEKDMKYTNRATVGSIAITAFCSISLVWGVLLCIPQLYHAHFSFTPSWMGPATIASCANAIIGNLMALYLLKKLKGMIQARIDLANELSAGVRLQADLATVTAEKNTLELNLATVTAEKNTLELNLATVIALL